MLFHSIQYKVTAINNENNADNSPNVRNFMQKDNTYQDTHYRFVGIDRS